MEDFIARVRTLLTALPTYLVVASVILTTLIAELEPFGTNEVVGVILRVASSLLVAVGIATAIVSRVTPVVDEQVGLLPVDHPTPIKKSPDPLLN